MAMRMGTCNQPSGAAATKTTLWLLSVTAYASTVFAATDVRVDFTLHTTDVYGAPLTQSRYYYVYRPDGLSKAVPVPAVLAMETVPGGGPYTFFHRKADQAGFVSITCSSAGNSSGDPGTGWKNHDPRTIGYEDIDYITEVINRVRQSDNCTDAFIWGFSTGGHTAYAYACERPWMVRAVSSVDEFMGLTSNIPTAPLPVIAFHGTADTSVSYTLGRDTVDAWRMLDGLLGAQAVLTYEAAPLAPGKVTRATWRGGINGTQVAFVTIVGGIHQFALPGSVTGYDCTDGMWAFFSQFLTRTQDTPKIVSQPVNNLQPAGYPASFWVAATGDPPLTCQWQKNGVDIPGATSNWYTTPATSMADSGATFRAVVTNGSGRVISAAATLTVSPTPADPKILTLPADQTVMAGQPVSLTVVAAGTTPLSYQWQKNGVDVVGATASSLNVPAAIGPDSGAPFTVVVSNRFGSTTSTSEDLFVTTAATSPKYFVSPLTVSARVGDPFRYIIISSGATEPIAYSASLLPAGLSMDAATGAISGTPVAPGTTKVLITASNSAGSLSAILVLTVTQTPVVVPIETWRRDHFGASAIDPDVAGDAADPDGDGVNNLLEYTHGTDPLKADVSS